MQINKKEAGYFTHLFDLFQFILISCLARMVDEKGCSPNQPSYRMSF